MCERGSRLKFCTCDVDDPAFVEPAEPFSWWTLYVKDTVPSSPIVGSFLPMNFDGTSETIKTHCETFSAHFIAQQLNEANLFDFDYVPKAGDHLVIELSGGTDIRLEYKHGMWVYDERSAAERENDTRVGYSESLEFFGATEKCGYIELVSIR